MSHPATQFSNPPIPLSERPSQLPPFPHVLATFILETDQAVSDAFLENKVPWRSNFVTNIQCLLK